MKIALHSADILWEDINENLLLYDSLISNLEKKGAIPDLLVFPELFTTGFSVSGDFYESPDGTSLNWMRGTAIKHNMAIVASVVVKEEGCLFNRAYFVYPDGKYEYYNKRHLFSFGKENLKFTRGNNKVVIPYLGFNISINICYDLRFPVWSRNRGTEYDLMINIANWPSSRSSVIEPLCKARAIENQSFFVFVNRSGKDILSSYNGEQYVIDYLGNKVDGAILDDNTVLYEIEKEGLLKYRGKFKAWEDADHFDLSIE